jgi:hypothetical protein
MVLNLLIDRNNDGTFNARLCNTDEDTIDILKIEDIDYVQSDKPIIILDNMERTTTKALERFIDETWNTETHDNQAWFEGWLSGLCDFGNITEEKFDELVEYVKAKQ